jgi:hypothetical protein
VKTSNFFSVAFVVIILVNALGYYGVFLGLHYRHDAEMTKVLDADVFNEFQTITLRLPVSIPYMPDQSEFERVSGKFEHEGEHYLLLKQRYSKDTLTVVCVRDLAENQIEQVLSDYAKAFTDNAAHQAIQVNFDFLKDYLPNTFAISPCEAGWSRTVSYGTSYSDVRPSFCFCMAHPPERVL